MIRTGNPFWQRLVMVFIAALMHVVFGALCVVGWLLCWPLLLWYWFTDDAAVYDRVKRFGQAEDEAAGVVLFNGYPRETISSRLGRRLAAGKTDWVTVHLDRLLDVFQKDHAEKSIQEHTEELPL